MRTQIISKRKLSKLEAVDFAAQITETPNIVGYLPKELQRLNDVIVIGNRNQAEAMLVYVETGEFIDLKILIVKKESRGHGLGHKLFLDFIERFGKTPKPIYCVTKNKIVIEMLEQQGFKKIGFYNLPLPCILHQSKMIFSLYRTKEYLRKLIKFHGQDKFKYYIKWPSKP